jgi:lipid-binding SYLF domain-containing protein
MKGLRTIGLLTVVLLIGQSAGASWEADATDKSQTKAADAITRFRDRIPRTEKYFEQAYGYAILPSVTRVGFGFGGAYGKGFVIEGDNAIGTTKFFQFTSGIQAGAKNFSMIVFFKDKEALENYQSGKLQFLGQAGLAFATVGVAGTPAFNDGVAMVTVTRLGLMGEFTISGARFSYKPLSKD